MHIHRPLLAFWTSGITSESQPWSHFRPDIPQKGQRLRNCECHAVVSVWLHFFTEGHTVRMSHKTLYASKLKVPLWTFMKLDRALTPSTEHNQAQIAFSLLTHPQFPGIWEAGHPHTQCTLHIQDLALSTLLDKECPQNAVYNIGLTRLIAKKVIKTFINHENPHGVHINYELS